MRRDWRTPAVLILLALPCLIPFNFMPNARLPVLDVPLGWAVFFPSGILLLISSLMSIGWRRAVPAFFLWTFLLTLSLILSSWGVERRGVALSTAAGFAVRSVAVGWAGFFIGRDPKSREQFLSWIPWVGAAAALAAVFEVASGRFFLIARTVPSDVNFHELFLPSYRVAAGPIGQPLPLSALLNLVLPFGVYRWIRHRDGASAAMTLAIVAGLVLTYRRSAYIVMAMTTLVLLIVEERRLLKPAFVAAAAGVFLATAIPPVRHHIAERFNPAETLREISAGHRAEVYGTTWKILKERPLLGIGTRQYEKSYLRYARYKGAVNTQDSQYLRMAAENGIVGLGALLGFVGYVLWVLRRNPSPDAWPFFLACAGFAVTLLVLDGLYWPAPSMAFLAIAGVGCGAADAARQ